MKKTQKRKAYIFGRTKHWWQITYPIVEVEILSKGDWFCGNYRAVVKLPSGKIEWNNDVLEKL